MIPVRIDKRPAKGAERRCAVLECKRRSTRHRPLVHVEHLCRTHFNKFSRQLGRQLAAEFERRGKRKPPRAPSVFMEVALRYSGCRRCWVRKCGQPASYLAKLHQSCHLEHWFCRRHWDLLGQVNQLQSGWLNKMIEGETKHVKRHRSH